jgi:O-antigen/teichoic acid export membrane protein
MSLPPGNTLARNTFILACIRVLAALSGLLFWMLAARLASRPQVIGQATALISAAALLSGLSQAGLGYALVRYLSQARDRIRLVNAVLTAVASMTCAAGVLFFLGIGLWSPAWVPLLEKGPTGLLFAALLLPLALTLALNWVFLALRKPVYTLVKHLLQLLCALALLGLFFGRGASYQVIVAAFAAGTVAGLLAGGLWLLPRALPGHRSRPANPFSLGRPFARYAASNFLVDQLQRAPDSLMILIILHLLGPVSSAYFFVAWGMLSGMQGIAGSAATSLFAEGSHQPAAAAKHTRSAARLGLSLALLTAIAVLLAGRLVLGLYGAAYVAGAYGLLQTLALSLIPGIAVPICLSVLRIKNRMKLLMLLSGLSFASGVLAVFAGAIVAGLDGAGIGWLLSRLFMLFTVVVVWRGIGARVLLNRGRVARAS